MSASPGHWREYAMEGALLGGFMIAACGFATLLEHPASPVRGAIADPARRRLVMGLAMGGTAVGLIRSGWGRRSGAHMNPSLTLTYLRLGKVERRDALGYVTGQFAGGVAGVLLVATVLGTLAGHPAVHYAATVPGPRGTAVAFAAETAISFVLMAVALGASNSARLAPFTPFLCGALVATYITIEAPLSGMSMNPARSFASAVAAGDWRALWVYFTAPPLGMLAAAEAYARLRGVHRVFCAKLDHGSAARCIFRCSYAALAGAPAATRPAALSGSPAALARTSGSASPSARSRRA